MTLPSAAQPDPTKPQQEASQLPAHGTAANKSTTDVIEVAQDGDWPILARSLLLATSYFGQQAPPDVDWSEPDGLKLLVQEDECDAPCALQSGEQGTGQSQC